MAVRVIAPSKLHHGAHQWSWGGLLNGDTGGPLNDDLGSIQFSDKTVHVKGTFGAGGTLVIEGSNDGTTWATLKNAAAAALSFTSEDVETILESPRYIRPSVTAGDGTTNLTVIIVGRALLLLR